MKVLFLLMVGMILGLILPSIKNMVMKRVFWKRKKNNLLPEDEYVIIGGQ